MNNIFIESFSKIEDPRIDRTKKHLLMDIVALTLFAWFRKMALSLLVKDGAKASNRKKMLKNWANPKNILEGLKWI